MPNSENNERPPLRHYHESWWKIDGEPIWYLAGRDPNYTPGMWYFHDETESLTGPYDTYEACAKALKTYVEQCL